MNDIAGPPGGSCRAFDTAVPALITIAVAERDDLIRALLERWLADAGHRVVCLTPADPLPDGPFDLVIASVDNPRTATAEVRALQAAHGAPLLLTSARFFPDPTDAGSLAQRFGVRAVLAKPYDRVALLAAVAECLR